MSKRPKVERTFRRSGEYLIVRVARDGIELGTGAANTRRVKWFRWGYRPARLIAVSVVAGTMPLYAAADWFEDNAGVWADHRHKQVPRDWAYCVRQLWFFAKQ